MNKALEQPSLGQFRKITERGRKGRPEVRSAGWLAVFAVSAIALGVWFAWSAGVPQVAAAIDETVTLQVPYFPSQYLNQASEPSPAPPTF
jgi:hypothetical protein